MTRVVSAPRHNGPSLNRYQPSLPSPRNGSPLPIDTIDVVEVRAVAPVAQTQARPISPLGIQLQRLQGTIAVSQLDGGAIKVVGVAGHAVQNHVTQSRRVVESPAESERQRSGWKDRWPILATLSEIRADTVGTVDEQTGCFDRVEFRIQIVKPKTGR